MAEEKKHSRAASAMSGSKKKSKSKSGKKKKKEPRGIHVSRLSGGGYLAKHDQHPEDAMAGGEPEQYHVPDEDQLAQHFQEHLPSQEPQEEAAQPQSQASPMQGAM